MPFWPDGRVVKAYLCDSLYAVVPGRHTCEGWNPFSSYGDGRSEHTGVYEQEEDYYECKGETAKVAIVSDLSLFTM